MKNFDIIIRPIITEQSMMDMENNKYTFEVAKTSNKSEIKKAIEAIFSVKVAKVNTMNMTGKVKRQGMNVGKRPNWKKAIVTLTDDSQPIEFFDSMQ
ncbi:MULTISPECIES: 50S ribosomal protein L23 [Aedoeadaptatus]|uniref:Large ribosomal subunit protein uL23 n=1 Tax=Aedoeadaptatus acetigenes TaxID=2981723 RepID=A0ABV1J422_9FIRM|nr:MULTISPECIES: 50S ribosomal protein L23 [Peptoniphilaceae]MBS6525457.1 50S ribosomal protein L23 [Peptoniphilaceae bacterium]MCU6786173.1 50S ribosomal protein L23 [Aedoeadaptatus acetigenes]